MLGKPLVLLRSHVSLGGDGGLDAIAGCVDEQGQRTVEVRGEHLRWPKYERPPEFYVYYE